MGVAGGRAEVVMVQLRLAVVGAESLTLAVKVFAPAVVGVPVTAPVEELRVKPAGSTPGVMEYNV
jgi:hypothetical protein